MKVKLSTVVMWKDTNFLDDSEISLRMSWPVNSLTFPSWWLMDSSYRKTAGRTVILKPDPPSCVVSDELAGLWEFGYTRDEWRQQVSDAVRLTEFRQRAGQSVFISARHQCISSVSTTQTSAACTRSHQTASSAFTAAALHHFKTSTILNMSADLHKGCTFFTWSSAALEPPGPADSLHRSQTDDDQTEQFMS